MTGDVVHLYINAAVRASPDALETSFAEAMPAARLVYWDSERQFIDGLAEAEYLMALSPPNGHWPKAGKLKLLQSVGASIDNLLPADDLPQGVIVANAKGVAAEPMSDYGLALALSLTMGLHRAAANQRNRQWRSVMPRDIAASTLGIMGLGAIGTPLARKARQLGFKVAGLNHKKKPNEFADAVYGLAELDEFLSVCDIIVILLPITDETRNLMSRDRLNRMKKGALLVNLGRGNIVDEAALLDKLTDGSLGGAAFDVFATEPLPPDSPLWDAPNMIVTPHNAGLFPNYYKRIMQLFAENIACVKAGRPVRTPVDIKRQY